MSGSLQNAISAGLLLPLCTAAWRLLWRCTRLRRSSSFFEDWAASSVFCIVAGSIVQQWSAVAGWGISGAIALVIFWWRRRKGRHRAAKLIGAKARALRDALVRKAREVARPRPVLKPAPVPR